jgi:hypothetical protein
MKQILFFAALLFSLTGSAQIISDNIGGYGRIKPIQTKWDAATDATRLYVRAASPFSTGNQITVEWFLYDSVYIDANTNDYHALDRGSLQYPVTTDVKLFDIADTLLLYTIRQLNSNSRVKIELR